MKVCSNCGFRDNPKWRNSRFDYNADYLRFDEAMAEPELAKICEQLKDEKNFIPLQVGPVTYYRRGTGGIYLYRVPNEDFKVPRERVRHKDSPLQAKLAVEESVCGRKETP